MDCDSNFGSIEIDDYAESLLQAEEKRQKLFAKLKKEKAERIKRKQIKEQNKLRRKFLK